MGQQPFGDQGSTPPSLPDFGASGGSTAGGSGAGGGGLGGGLGGPGGGSNGDPGRGSADGTGGGPGRGGLIALLVGGAATLVVLIVIAALVLWFTVLRPSPEGDDPTADDSPGVEEPSDSPEGEYIPTESEEPQEPDPEQITFTEDPSMLCTLEAEASSIEGEDGWVTGGGLQYELQDGWEADNRWGLNEPYLTDIATSYEPVESGWISLSSVGTVEFPEDEGGYPGAQAAAVAMMQCSLTGTDPEELYGPEPEIREYNEESFSVDGHEGWRVTATVALADDVEFSVTDAWTLEVIVIDGPEGPVGFLGGAATGMEEQVADLEAMLASLRFA